MIRCCMVLIGIAALVPAAGTAAGSAAESWAEFAVVLKRNVFDPDRNRPVPPSVSSERESPPPPPPEAVDLRGVFADGDAAIALLTGTRPEWQGTVRLASGAPVGPGTLRSFSTLALTLEIDGATVDWPVGTRLVKGYDGWAVDSQLGTAQLPAASAAAHPVDSSASSPGPVPTETGSSDRDAILKRLMERRMKESQ